MLFPHLQAGPSLKCHCKILADNDPDKHEIGFDMNAGFVSSRRAHLALAQQSPFVGVAFSRCG